MQEKFSRIIQGCMTWGAWGKQLSKTEMAALIRHSIEDGITTFDHADIYGDYTTEAEFGDALEFSGVDREQLQLISKCGIQYVGKTRNNSVKHYQYDADYIIWSAEKSIKDLKCSYLNLFLLHRPSPLMHPDEIAKAADHLKASGLVKSFGVSNFYPSETALIASKVKIEANQIEFSLTAFNAMHNGSLNDMMLKNVIPMCWSPLGVVFREKTDQTDRIHKVLEELTKKYSATKDQLLLTWILKHPAKIHPVIGTTNSDRITNAAKSAAIPLTEIDWFRLLIASQGHKVA
ncbi:MAG: putative oxidoreductase [Ulvibacter sp.]|jgi:predicted oxidoreductase